MEIDNKRFSRLLLNLYRTAESRSTKEFRDAALAEVQQLLPFDGCVWSTCRLGGSQPWPHLWALDGAPPDMRRLFETDPDGHHSLELAKLTLENPRIWAVEEMTPGSPMALFTADAGMRQVIIISDWNETLEVFNILIFGRRDLRQPFDEGDKALLTLLLPHLQAAVALNVESRTRATLVNRIAGNVGLAIVCDDTIVMEETGFAEILRQAWPRHVGPGLPLPIREALKTGKTVVSCDGATIHLMYGDDHVLLLAAPPSVLHALTRKEFAIASDFAQGKSYKEVARDHGLPPETVRSRLRSVYEKLSVSDKAELSRRFAQTELLESLHGPF